MEENNYQNRQNNADVQAAVTAALAEEKKKKKKKKWIIIAVIAVVIVAVIAAVGSGGDKEESSAEAGSESSDVQAENPNKDNDNVLGDYTCVVKGATLTKDWEGKDAVIVTYDFTNNSDNPISFDVALDDNVYQNGVGLELAILDEETDTFDVQIKKGVTKEVKKAYVLRDTSTELEIEISELISLSNDKITTKVKLK